MDGADLQVRLGRLAWEFFPAADREGETFYTLGKRAVS
jgi:hypothetical protein